MTVEQTWATRHLEYAAGRIDKCLATTPKLACTHSALDKSVFNRKQRVLSTLNVSEPRQRSLQVSPVQESKKRPRVLQEREHHDRTHSNQHARWWCADDTFELADLTRFAQKRAETPNTNQAEELSSSPPPATRPVPAQTESIRCLQALMRGMESHLFRWNDEVSIFEARSIASVETISQKTISHIYHEFMAHGTHIRRLKLAAEHIYAHAKQYDATVIALAVFVRDFVEHCEASCASTSTRTRQWSMTSICNELDTVRASATWLAELIGAHISSQWLLKDMSLSSVRILDLVTQEVRLQTCISGQQDQVARELLDCLLEPLMHEIDARTGIGAQVDFSSGFLLPEHANDYSQLTYKLDTRPAILPADICKTVNDAEKAMLFLLQHGDRRFLDHMDSMRSTTEACVHLNNKVCIAERETHDTSTGQVSASTVLKTPDGHMIHRTNIETSYQYTRTAMSSTSFLGRLALHDTANCSFDLDQAVEDILVPRISRHCVIIHGAVLRILLHEMRLREHLELAQQVFFFQNGMFVSKLREAIFSHSGGSLDINYEGRKALRWPPAAAKVSMATRRIILESIPAHYKVASKHALAEVEFFGHLGFMMSLEEEEEVSRHSLNALSFLVFSFRPPKPIDLIMTQRSIRLYTRVNQFLLILLRMSDAVQRMMRDAFRFRAMRRFSPLSERFRLQATHFVTAFSAHVLDTVIAIEIQKFINRLEEQTQSIEQLRDAHLHMLDHICHGLLISPRMAELQAILRKAFEAILSFSLLPIGTLSTEVEQVEVKSLYDTFVSNARKLAAVLIGSEATKEDSFAAGISARLSLDDFPEV